MAHKNNLEASVSSPKHHSYIIDLSSSDTIDNHARSFQDFISANMPSASIIPSTNQLTAFYGTFEFSTPIPGPKERIVGFIVKGVITIAIAFIICGSLAWVVSLTWLWRSVCTYGLAHSILFLILTSSYR